MSKIPSTKHFYTNGIIDRKFSDDEPIPEGWHRGRTNCGKGTSGKIWINNGVERRYVNLNDDIPNGWVRGNLKFTKEHKENLSKSLRGKVRTEEQKQRIKEAHNTEEYKNKIKQVMLNKYGVSNPYQIPEVREKAIKNSYSDEAQAKKRATCRKHFGVDYPMQSDVVKDTLKKNNLEKYGCASVLQLPEVKEKAKQTSKIKYGTEYPSQSKQFKDKVASTNMSKYGTKVASQSDIVKQKMKNTNIERRGVPYPLNDPKVLEKQITTNLERYNVMYNIQLPQSYIGSSRNSKPNKDFAELLDTYGIVYTREFNLEKYIFDFKVDNILIEIDPSATHNTIWSPFGDHAGIDTLYHYNKTNFAISQGYRVIHIFDWDDKNKIVANFLTDRKVLYARNTVLCKVSTEETNNFLKNYHLQGKCNGQSIRLGLKTKDNELVAIMTFGKPRYNNNYEWELLRYCSKYNIVGGAEKLFNYFVKNYSPNNVISYCDKSKFVGTVYTKLGFYLKSNGKPVKHWYNPNEKIAHITDNFLRQRGFDQLFGTSYGKGTSNEELIIDRGYVSIYDCGQNTYVWNKP